MRADPSAPKGESGKQGLRTSHTGAGELRVTGWKDSHFFETSKIIIWQRTGTKTSPTSL